MFEQISARSSVIIFIFNVLTGRFVYQVDKKKVAGYDTALYLADNGVHFNFSNFRKDLLPATLIIQQKAFDYLNTSKEEKSKIVMNTDGMYKISNGDYIHFLQQTACIESDDNENGILYLSYIHNITYLKKEKTSNFIITTPTDLKWWNFNFDNNVFEPVHPLSKQEKNILAYLAKGKSSKEIAKELFISPHTVNTHRKHLLEKTNCINTTGMITYCKIVGLI
jgi:DNA-binding CsgD family transcriptional regulator